MKSDACPVCLSSDTVEVRPQSLDITKLAFTYEFSPQSQKTFRVVRCRICTHVFCRPLPKDLYKYYEDVVDEEYLRHQKTRELSAKAVLQVLKRLAPPGKMLDVGCATGDFLREARTEGYSAEGLELSHWSSKRARHQGLQIHRETLQSHARTHASQYDIITLWGVIEHFERPRQEMPIYIH